MKTNLKIFCGLSIFAIIAVANIAHAATTPVVNNKTSQFNDVLSEMGASTTDSSNAALAETIRRQRALLDAAGDTGATTTGGTNITTANACDAALRKCMSEKCGADFTKCASDSTTVWGNKMDACRRNTKCTGHEYTLLAPEILADRNAAIELSYYNSVVNCGNRYNNCVFGICGKSLENCLSKSAGDSAIAKCKSIADECREQDSGLAARVMGVFGDRRTIAATEAQRNEKRLYELRDLMRTQCTRFGAMFDERTLDCVYTVNFFAGADNTLMASKKLYSGDTFQCTPDWFGVDITTYMENAQRLTRSQTSASAAAMGAGLGTAASLWTSGAVTRAMDTQKAEKQAKEKCTAVGGEWVSAGFNQGSKCDMRKPKADCESKGGTWNDEKGCLDKNGQPISLSTGGGSNPGETCSSYSGGPDICERAHGDKCSWVESIRKCVDKGTEEQYTTPPKNDEKAWKEYCKQQLLEYDTRTGKCTPCDNGRKMVDGKCTDQQLTNSVLCPLYKTEENCPTDKCEWKKEKDNKGECVAKTDSSTGGDRNPANPNIDCDKACNDALNSLIEDVQKKKTSKNWWYAVTSKRLTNTECANQCVTKANDICNQLVDNTVYTDDTGDQYRITKVSAVRQDLAPHGTDVYAHNIACEPNYVKVSKGNSGTTGSGSGTGNTTTTNTNGRVVGGACIEEDIKKLKPYGWTSGTYIRVSEKANSTTVLKAHCETKKGAGDNVPCNCKATQCDGDNGYEANSNGLCVKKKNEQKPAEKPKETSTEKPVEKTQEKSKESPKQTTTGQLDPSVDGISFCYYDIDGGSKDLKYCNAATPGRFGVVFPNMTIYGDAVCSNVKTRKEATKAAKQSEINLTYNTDHDENKGKYCYCRVIDPRKSGVYYSPWVSGVDSDYFSDFEDCARLCAANCTAALFAKENFRRVLFGE